MMPVLENARHEIFAKAVAGGKSASEAYRGAGYRCAPRKARGHGYRLRSRADISARIHELSAKALAHVVEPTPAAKIPHKRKPKARTLPKFEHQRPGQPTRYEPAFRSRARRLALLGLTDTEIADLFGISPDTLYEWRRRHPEFSDSLDAAKIEADAHVAEGLYNRARGMSVPAVKIFQGTPEGGPVIVPHQEHLPPDVGAAKLWLRNRQPERWRERHEMNVTGTVAHRLAQMSAAERGAFALDLARQARQRLIDAGVIIEHEPEPAPDDQPEAEPEE